MRPKWVFLFFLGPAGLFRYDSVKIQQRQETHPPPSPVTDTAPNSEAKHSLENQPHGLRVWSPREKDSVCAHVCVVQVHVIEF